MTSGLFFLCTLMVCAGVVLISLPVSAQTLNRRLVIPRLQLAPGTNAATRATVVEAPATAPIPPAGTQPIPGVNTDGTAPAATGDKEGASTSKTPEEKRLQELLRLKFDRSASSILDTLAEQLNGKSGTNEVEVFQQHVIAGNWAEMGKFLRTLPADHSKQVYRHVLKELAATTGGRTSRTPTPEQPNQPGGRASSPTLVADDVLSVAAHAPQALEAEDAKLLGQLLAKLLARGDALEPLLPKLNRGVNGVGGKDPVARQRAAEMLVAADRLIEAGEFLASTETALEKKDWEALELRARQLIALNEKEKNSAALKEAWEINQLILASTNITAARREEALRRSFELMPLISRETGTNWLRQNFQNSPAQGLLILSAVSELVQQNINSRSVVQRQNNLDLQKQVVETFLDIADPAQPHWRTALNLLAQNWMQEATYARQRFQPRRHSAPIPRYDAYGNLTYIDPVQPVNQGGQNPAISVERALDSAPGDRWLAQLDASLRLAVDANIADLCLKAETPEKALPYIEALAKAQPEAAAQLANDFLETWARLRSPSQNTRVTYNSILGYISPYAMRSQGIPLTRAMQARNIRELSGLFKRLEAMKLPPLKSTTMVSAFSAAHSPAEVFRTEDIESVFGSVDGIRLDVLAGLAQTMRERLAVQWRQSRVQQDAKTQRTDKQIEEELMRGYEVVLKLIGGGLERDSENWQLSLAQAAVNFDLAEFQYGKKVDLAIYLEKREQAFQAFERAAELYAAALPKIPEKDQSPEVFQQWFSANLGASDLNNVTHQQEPETNQLQRIQTALAKLPGDAAERHTSAFAKTLGQTANTLKPELKPRYLKAGLYILGNHPDAEDARRLATYYDDLLQEVEFVVQVDGDSVVGHTRPFGVFVSLRHTADIEREAGGFGRYLRSQKRPTYTFYGAQQRSFVDDFEKLARERLSDKFEVKSITFADEKVQSRGYGRIGWRETPLAYLMIQAKDASVDQIPVLSMDLDFSDQRGLVVLPVESPIVLLDARPERVGPRPVADVEVTQTLDDREIGEGLLTLEIKATGKGLMPELNELLRTNFAGLQVSEVDDRGVAVTQIDTEGDAVAAVTERNWLLKLKVADDAPAALSFRFPESALPEAKMIFKRYSDADLVEVKPEIALAGFTLRPRPWWHWLILALVLVGGAVAVKFWLSRRKTAHELERPAYTVPDPITPFALINLLRRMHADDSLNLRETDRTELAKTLGELETHFFARERNGHPEPDLSGIGRRWVELAGNGR